MEKNTYLLILPSDWQNASGLPLPDVFQCLPTSACRRVRMRILAAKNVMLQ